MSIQALEQTRDSVLRYGEVVGCELLNFFVRQQEAQSKSREAPSLVAVSPIMVVAWRGLRACGLRVAQLRRSRIGSAEPLKPIAFRTIPHD